MSPTATVKKPISVLSLLPESLLLTESLTPNALIPNPSIPRNLEREAFDPEETRDKFLQSRFPFTSPLPLPLPPYQLQPPDPPLQERNG